MPIDLHILPKLKDSLSFLYVEHAIIEQKDTSIIMIREDGKTPIPIASLTVLLIGPGVTITHAAIKAVCDCGCSIVWSGEDAFRFYAMGLGETRKARNLLKQAALCMNKELHLEVVRKMYAKRFPKLDTSKLGLREIRGLEGIRMRESYKHMARFYGVDWKKRDYKHTDWNSADPLNRALSAANSALYGVCQAAIVSLGYSTGLGFIHTGKMLSFVYDVADLYKTETTLPAAFQAVRDFRVGENLERKVRINCRQFFHERKILKRIPEDLDWLFDIDLSENNELDQTVGDLWDEEEEAIAGGMNHGVDLNDSHYNGKR